MSEEEIPGWMRALEIIFGLAAIILAIVIIIAPLIIATEILLTLVSIGIIILGIGVIYRGIAQKEKTNLMRFLLIIGGIILIGLGIFFQLEIYAGALITMWIFAIVLVVDGIYAIAWGLTSIRIKRWQRWLVLIIGVAELILGVFVAVIPYFGITIFNILAAVMLLLVGFMYLIAGITATKYIPTMPSAMAKDT